MTSAYKSGGQQSVGAEVTALFRTKRVSEIRQIEARVRSEAEDKAEALRDLLGTRYKDLLSAANTVLSVRDASNDRVTSSLRQLSHTSSELRGHFLQQATASPKTKVPDDVDRRRQEQVVAGQLKHIVDSTEALYAYLEAGRLYDAAARLAAAERNFNLLNENGGESVKRFSTAQWKNVSQFRAQIKSAANAQLVKDGLLVDEYAQVVAALIVLGVDDESTASGVLKKFLEARASAVRKELTENTGAMDARMREVAMLVKATIASVAQMMRVDDQVEEKENADKSNVIALVRSADPNNVVSTKVIIEVTGKKLHDICVPWLGDVRKILESDGRMLLDGVNTARELATALMDVDDILVDEEWSESCRIALGVHPRTVFGVFEPVISERANVVSQESVMNVSAVLEESLMKEWDEIKEEMDTGTHVWASVVQQSMYPSSESISTNLPHSHEKSPQISNLLLASGGSSSIVQQKFAEKLDLALSDAKYISERVPSVSITFTKAVFESTPGIISSLTKRIDNLMAMTSKSETVRYEDREQAAERALLVARVAAILLGCSDLKQAFHFEVVMQNGDGDGSEKEEYRKFCNEIRAISDMAYSIWAAQVCVRLKDKLKADLSTTLMRSLPAGWVKEETSRRNSGDTEKEGVGMEYARTASVGAVRFWTGACMAANKGGGLALPKKALECLKSEMVRVLMEAYDVRKGGSENADESDGERLQKLFDFRMFALLLAKTRSEKKKLFREHITTLEGTIDPIDLAHCKQDIEKSVAEYAARTWLLFGILNNNSSGEAVDPVVSSTETANIMVMAPGMSRLAYLPAPMPSTYTLASGNALSARAAVEQLKLDSSSTGEIGNNINKSRNDDGIDIDSAVADYATKVTDTVGRIGSRFLGNLLG